MGNYHDLYLRTDFLLLPDVFEKFINTCLDYYGLDPCHFFFIRPELSWDTVLKMTRIELKLISNIGMHLYTEKGMAEGISYIAKSFSEANNKYMQTINHMVLINSQVNLLCIWMRIIYISAQWVDICFIVDWIG